MADQKSQTLRASDAGPPKFELPSLPYGLDALIPVLSAETLTIHYGKHHARYVETLNQLLVSENYATETLESVVRTAHATNAQKLFNNAAQAWNHAFFWESMSPIQSRPGCSLADAINTSFGGLEALGERFITEGTGHFASGWVWLVVRERKLDVISTHDAGCPILEDGLTPLLACDVWEHAYYIDYRQNRAQWLMLWWEKLANWTFAQTQYDTVLNHGEPWCYPASRPHIK
ncbi:superoxide dismutase [Fe] [Caenibius tardaugens NBRC 16725]|uniref:Superoxide dismutase n=1 Tax=Caenibius tardaugens NBRC 16725 TaxID=1219035 RepID=U3A7Z3_9SPHN|nr:superoxide dismutase [Caenibius tardaugens]AZI36338.1 superoxide dismutase [Caenibius tardaugens NBRC 16725]GAD50863.1 superoxide dismutase [Fe] [Caenibius tardaugens NBRC 16725]